MTRRPKATHVPLSRYEDALWALDVDVEGTTRTFLLDTAAGITTLDPLLVEAHGLIYDGNLGASFLEGRVVTLDLANESAFASA